jgi:Zn-dependent protease with chaperone function
MCINNYHNLRLNTLFSQNSKDKASDCLKYNRRELLKRAAIVGLGVAVVELFGSSEEAEAFDLFPLPSINDQKKVGKDAAKQVLDQYKLVTDSRSAEVKAVGAKLLAALPEPDKSRWDYDFHLVVGKDINAFALPGGPLFFFTGLFDNMSTEDELAAVIGHEMTHVRAQHWAKAYREDQKRSVFIGIGEIVTHTGNLGQQVIGFVNDTWSLKYSRGEESEADKGGLQDMVSAGYNPKGMTDMFNVLLKKTGNGGNSTSVYLSNHPLTTDRIKATQDQIAKLDSSIQFPPERPIGSATGTILQSAPVSNSPVSTPQPVPSPGQSSTDANKHVPDM